MLRFVYLYRNLTRNVVRTLLTCAAVALPIMIYVLSTAVINGLEEFLDNSAKQLRLVVEHRTSVIHPLPVGYRMKIESLDPSHTRLLSTCGVRWVGGRVENSKHQLSTLAVDVDTFMATFPEHKLASHEIDAWFKDRTAFIVGSSTAGTYGWKVGDHVTIRMSAPPYAELKLNIIAIGTSPTDAITCFCRADYAEEEVKKAGAPEGFTNFFFVKCATQKDMEYFGTKIDEMFANSPDETRTNDEKSWMNDWIRQQFDLQRNLAIFAAVTVFVAIMAATNTMSMNFRDRVNELAVLRSIGFRARTIFGFIQAESMLLCLLGGTVGALVPFIAFSYTPLRDYSIPVIENLEVRPNIVVWALLMSVAIGVVSGLWPSWQALRLRTVHALRNLE